MGSAHVLCPCSYKRISIICVIGTPVSVRHLLGCGSAVVKRDFVVNLCLAQNSLFWEIMTKPRGYNAHSKSSATFPGTLRATALPHASEASLNQQRHEMCAEPISAVKNAFLSTSSTRPIPIFVGNRTERASGLSFLWELAELFCLQMLIDGSHSSNMSAQVSPTAAHSQSYADFPFNAPRHTCHKETDALGRRYDAFLSMFSTRPTPVFVRNRTERASGLSFLWELAELCSFRI